jgi:aryl-alcohol dehydrogenase-like predicted oxidoreductase
LKYRLLGKSGLRVSEAALGTMTFGDEWGWGSPKDEAQKVYETYREAGGNFVDTANFYTNGTSERFMGEFIQGHRESVVLATKYSIAAPGNDPNAAGNHRKNMMQAGEASLKRLQTDYIDLYWVHIWDGITPVEEVMGGLDDIVRQGKVSTSESRTLPPGGLLRQILWRSFEAGQSSSGCRSNTASLSELSSAN